MVNAINPRHLNHVDVVALTAGAIATRPVDGTVQRPKKTASAQAPADWVMSRPAVKPEYDKAPARYRGFDVICYFAIRRCDRGTGAMHLANTPVVSPESKNPAGARFSNFSNCHFRACTSLLSCRSSAKHDLIEHYSGSFSTTQSVNSTNNQKSRLIDQKLSGRQENFCPEYIQAPANTPSSLTVG